MSDDGPVELAAALAFLPTAADAARYPEPKRGVMELFARVRGDPAFASDLAEAARSRPDLFDDDAVGYLTKTARVHKVSARSCAALEHVVRSRRFVPPDLDAVLMEVLDNGQLDAAAALATTCAELGSVHADDVIRRLSDYIYEHDSFISFSPRPDWLPPLLRRLADVNAPLLAERVAARLRHGDESARHGAATFAGELAVAHPEVAATLSPAVLASLEMESPIFESGTTAAVDALAVMYVADPDATDAAISAFRARASDRAKKRALGVYERAVYLATDHVSTAEFVARALRHEPPRVVYSPDDLTGRVVDRVLELMRSEANVDTWDEASDALEEAGRFGSTAALRLRLDALIFTLLEATRLSTQGPPQIELVGVPKKPEALIALEKQHDDMRWSGVLSGVSSAIAGALRDSDPTAIAGLVNAIERLRPLDTDGWTRAALVKVLRVLLGTPEGRARLVPLLYGFLMDGAVPVQIAALELCEGLVEDHQDELPQLLLDTVSLLVISTYTYVGRAAVRVADHIRARSDNLRLELVGRLVARSRAEGTDWEPRLRAIAAAVRVADDDGDIGARIVASEGVRFFTDAPSLYGRNEIWQFRRFNPPPMYQVAYGLCIIRHLERPLKPHDQPPVGDADDEIAALRGMDKTLLAQLVDQVSSVAHGLPAQDPGLSFDLTAVLSDAGRPDLAASACATIITQRPDTCPGHFYARLAEAARLYYEGEVALARADLRTATKLFAQSAQSFEAEHEY